MQPLAFLDLLGHLFWRGMSLIASEYIATRPFSFLVSGVPDHGCSNKLPNWEGSLNLLSLASCVLLFLQKCSAWQRALCSPLSSCHIASSLSISSAALNLFHSQRLSLSPSLFRKSPNLCWHRLSLTYSAIAFITLFLKAVCPEVNVVETNGARLFVDVHVTLCVCVLFVC